MRDVQGGEFTGVGNSAAGLFKPFWVRVLSYDGVEFYAWEEVSPAPSGFTTLPGGRVGTVGLNPLYEANGAALTIDSYALISRAYFDDTLDWTYVGASNSAVGPGGTIELWCNCTVTSSVNTVQAEVGVASVLRLAAGNYLIVFDTNFQNKECFEWGWDCTGEGIVLNEVARTSNSVTVQTSDGLDADRWGIDVRGKVCEFEPQWYCMDQPQSGSGGDDCFTGTCDNPGVVASLTIAITAKTGCLTALPDNYTLDCVTSGSRHYYEGAPTLTYCSLGFFTAWLVKSPLGDGTPYLEWVDPNGSDVNVTQSETGYVCAPFSAVFLLDDGDGNTCTVTVTSSSTSTSTCLQLTASEVLNLQAAGWATLGGPFNTETECDADCTGSGSGSGSGSGGDCPTLTLCAIATGGSFNCECATSVATQLTTVLEGLKYTGDLTLDCPGSPVLSLDLQRLTTSLNFDLVVYGCGTAAYNVYANGCGIDPAIVAITPPNACCGVNAEDGFFITIYECEGGASGSGGDPPVPPGVEIIGLGTAQGSTNVLTIPDITVEAGILLVIVGAFDSETGATTVTYDGDPCPADVLTALDLTSGMGVYRIVTGAKTGDVVLTCSGTDSYLVQLVNVTGLSNNTMDQIAINADTTGTLMPMCGPTAPTTVADEAIIGCYILKTPGGSWTWMSLTSGGQDVTAAYGDLTEGRLVTDVIGTFSSQLTMSAPPAKWLGFVLTYS